ncbi:MAG: imelysin family protein [Devosia sp.]
MRLLAAVAAVLSLAATAAPAAEPAIPSETIIRSAIDNAIRPGFAAFAVTTAKLRSDVAALCATPSADTLEAARAQFAVTVLAFARVEFIRLGPLGESGRLERLLFWPDPRGFVLKQVQAALAAKDATATDPATLKGKSVALQGFGALEFLLFGSGAESLATAGDPYRCAYASAIAGLDDSIAAEISREWNEEGPDSAVGHMLDPQPDADDYRTPTEVLEKLAGVLIDGTETIRDQRLTPVIGTADGIIKPKSALFWRSGLAVPLIAADFAGLREFFVGARFPEALNAGQHGWVSSGTLFEFDNAARDAATVTDPIALAVTDERQLRALKALSIVTGSLDTLIGDNLAAALGLSSGFSALDGD